MPLHAPSGDQVQAVTEQSRRRVVRLHLHAAGASGASVACCVAPRCFVDFAYWSAHRRWPSGGSAMHPSTDTLQQQVHLVAQPAGKQTAPPSLQAPEPLYLAAQLVGDMGLARCQLPEFSYGRARSAGGGAGSPAHNAEAFPPPRSRFVITEADDEIGSAAVRALLQSCDAAALCEVPEQLRRVAFALDRPLQGGRRRPRPQAAAPAAAPSATGPRCAAGCCPSWPAECAAASGIPKVLDAPGK